MSRRLFVSSRIPLGPVPSGLSGNPPTKIQGGAHLFSDKLEASLLWADKIFMDRQAFEATPSQFRHPEGPECAALLLDSLRAEGIIEVIDSRELLPQITTESIWEQVARDTSCGSTPKDCQVEACGTGVCLYTVTGAYTSLMLAQFLGSSCLLQRQIADYLRLRFANLATELPEFQAAFGMQGVRDVYDVFVPSLYAPVCYDWSPDKQKCTPCFKGNKTNKERTVRYIDSLLKRRNDPDLIRLAQYVDEHLPEANYESDRLIAMLHRDIRRYEARYVKRQSTVKNWTRLCSLISLPVALLGASMQNSVLTIGGLAVSALAEGGSKANELLLSKHSWKTTLAQSIDYRKLAKHLRAEVAPQPGRRKH